MLGKTVGKRHDDGENHGGGTDHGGSNQDRLGRRLKRIARAVIFSSRSLARSKFASTLKSFFSSCLMLGTCSMRDSCKPTGRFGNRPVGVDGKGHRPHAQKSERHQAKREYGSCDHQPFQSIVLK